MPDENCRNLLQFIPFVGLVTGSSMSTPLTTRLLETAIMSAVSIGLATYVVLKQLEVKFQNMENQLTEFKREMKDEVKEIRRDLYVPRANQELYIPQNPGRKL
jgi:type III secretory pathway component EscU